jgi:hypothetical protein
MLAWRLALAAIGVGTAAANCAAPANEVVAENCRPGAPSSEWDVNGAGDPTIQGFATEISVPRGAAAHFKVRTDATRYRLDIYRLGYYGGAGARLVATILPHAPLPQLQPECLYEVESLLVDCGNWAVSATWEVPPNLASGIFIGRLVRTDGEPSPPNWKADNSQVPPDSRHGREGYPFELAPLASPHAYGASGHGKLKSPLREARASHIYFIVRPADAESAAGALADKVVFQTMDTTWQTYNCWGAANTYGMPCDNPGPLRRGSSVIIPPIILVCMENPYRCNR